MTHTAENDATPPWLPEVECVWCGFVSRTAPRAACPMCGGVIPPVVTGGES